MSLLYQNKNILLLFFLSSIWALHFSLVKIVEADNNPLSILIPLLFILCILFYVLLILKKELFKITIRKCIFFSIAGIFAYIVPLSVEFIVAPKIEAGILTLIVSIVPVFTLLIIWLFRLLNVTTKLLIGTLSGLVGLVILLYGNNYNKFSKKLMYYLAELTYRFGFEMIAISGWIKKMIGNETIKVIPCGINLDIYIPASSELLMSGSLTISINATPDLFRST